MKKSSVENRGGGSRTGSAVGGDRCRSRHAVRSVGRGGASGVDVGTDPSFNGPSLDGCPSTSPDGRRFFMASNRPGGMGGIDIWVASRSSDDGGWGPPVNVGAPVNSSDNDFCPMLAADGHTFYFVSNRPGGHGGTDVYVTRLRPRGWDPVENVCCGVNSPSDEAGPVPITEAAHGRVLYFSSNRSGGFSGEPEGAVTGDSDLYVSEVRGRYVRACGARVRGEQRGGGRPAFRAS